MEVKISGNNIKGPLMSFINACIEFVESPQFEVLCVWILASLVFVILLYSAYKLLGLFTRPNWTDPAYVLYLVGLYVQFVAVIIAWYFPDTGVYSMALIVTFLVLYVTYSSRQTLTHTLRGTQYVESSARSIIENAYNIVLFFKRGKLDLFSLFLAIQTILALHPSVLVAIFVVSVKLKVGFLAPMILFLSNFTLFLLSSARMQDFCQHKYGADGLKLLGWNTFWKQIGYAVPGGKRAAIVTVGVGVVEPWINDGVNAITSGTNLLSDIAYNKTQDIANDLAKGTPGYDSLKYAHHRSPAPNFKLWDKLPFLPKFGKDK